MASIWDLFNGNATPEQNAGLLGLAAGFNGALGDGSRPVNFGQALAAGALGMQQNRNAYTDRQREQEMAQQQAALRALQMRATGAEVSAAERAAQLQERIQASALTASQNGQFNPEAFINDVRTYDPLTAEKYAQQFAKAAPEYDTTPQILNGPNGPVVVQLSKTAAPRVLEGFTPREKAELLNLGGKSVAINPFAVQPGQEFTRTMTPGEAAANQLGWANNAVARGNLGIAGQRLAIDKQEAATRAAAVKAPTEFQGKSAGFGARAEEADRIITELQGKYSPARVNAKTTAQDFPLIGGITGAVANNFLSENEQKAEQAQRDFINAVLRQESGAAIAESEFNNARRQYFPQPGDSKAVIDQKTRNRQLAVQGFKNNAGKANFSAPPVNQGWAIKEVK